MDKIIKKLPLAIVGLMLGLAATGNLVQSYGDIYRNIFGIISAIILALVLVKIFIYPQEVKKGLENPVVDSVFPTLSMGIMLLSTYLKPYGPSLAYGIWIIGLLLHIFLIIRFSLRYLKPFKIEKVFPSWFIVYVGIVVGSVTGPAFNMIWLGKLLFWFGFISYFALMPVVIKRVFKVKNIPAPALPSIAIFSAPFSLCLAGYMSSFDNKNMTLVWLMLTISQLTYFAVLLYLPKLLKGNFYPSYSGFTFPLVISAISLKVTNAFLTKSGTPISFLSYIVKFEEVVAVIIVLYVLMKYLAFIFASDSKI